MVPRLLPLHRQVIVITGATSGIGLATARLAAKRGARLVLVARGAAALLELVTEIRAGGGRATGIVGNVTAEEDLERAAAEAIRTFGRIDTWVNNAAVSVYGGCLDVSTVHLHRVMDTNLWGTINGSRVACRHLARQGGALINIGSVLSDRAVPLQGVYSASKHAIKAWTDTLRTQLEARGAPVSVTLIKPGPIDTPYAEHAEHYFDEQQQHLPPVYTPRSVARAILHAATRPVRTIYVGSTAYLLALANRISPSATDLFMTHVFIRATGSGRPRRGRPILDGPDNVLSERGDYPGLTHASLYTLAVTHPLLTSIAAFGAGLAATAWWSGRQGREFGLQT